MADLVKTRAITILVLCLALLSRLGGIAAVTTCQGCESTATTVAARATASQFGVVTNPACTCSLGMNAGAECPCCQAAPATESRVEISSDVRHSPQQPDFAVLLFLAESWAGRAVLPAFAPAELGRSSSHLTMVRTTVLLV